MLRCVQLFLPLVPVLFSFPRTENVAVLSHVIRREPPEKVNVVMKTRLFIYLFIYLLCEAGAILASLFLFLAVLLLFLFFSCLFVCLFISVFSLFSLYIILFSNAANTFSECVTSKFFCALRRLLALHYIASNSLSL